MTDTQTFASFDGQPIAWRERGEGRPVVLLHGLFSSAETNWLKFGHADRIAAAGFRVILPDLRAHGESAKPREAAGWPKDALARDVLALIAHLELSPGAFDLGGYSLGARTTVRTLMLGAKPRRVVLSGMGLEGLTGATGRSQAFVDAIDNRDRNPPGSWQAFAMAFAKTNGADVLSARFLLADFPSATPAELATAVAMSTAVVCGRDDHDNGSAPALAEALPRARYVEVEGTHITAVTRPGLGEAIAAFLAELHEGIALGDTAT